METAIAPQLFDSAFLAKLEKLHLLSRKLFRGEHRAERRSRQSGSSLEFADHREYAPGDELRSIDWPAYGRLERLFVKLYEQERDLPVSFLIDASASMRWRPEPDRAGGGTKFDHARRLAAALAYIALANLDAVNIHYFATSLHGELGVSRGKAQFHGILDFLREAPEPRGATQMRQALREFTQRVSRRGLVFVMSDFFDASGCEEALAQLRHAQFEVHAIQVLAPEELEPASTGDLRLVDIETGGLLEVTANEAVLRRYREEIADYNKALEANCLRRGIAHASVRTDVSFEDVVLRVLRDGVMLK